ncbi:MAG: YfhO family protein [Candidatus Omnitrophica bacterium]|nr:YfhO family protein [Candidatus Omnitrophota bacterium]
MNFTKSNHILALLVFLFLSVLFTAPIYDNSDMWGQKDWDQFVMWNAVPYRTITEFRQFPLWNPYVNGGNVMLAHPQSAFLSPFFIFVLIFGPYLGLKIQITVHVFLGLWGMFLLAKNLALRDMAAYLAAFVFMFAAVYPLHLTEGHTEWLCMAFMSWLFLAYRKSLDDIRYVLAGIVFLSLILLNGSVDVFNIFNVFLGLYAVLTAARSRDWMPVKSLMMIFAGTFLLCAVKLFPMLDFIREFPRTGEEAGGGVTLGILFRMLLDPNQETLDMMNWLDGYRMGLTHEWHEYGAYVGILPLVLGLAGCVIFFRKYWPLIVSGMAMLLIALGDGTMLNAWQLLRRLPVYDSLTVPSRYIVGFVFLLALTAAMTLQLINDRLAGQRGLRAKVLKGAVVLMFLFIPYHLIEMNSSIFWNAFRVEPVTLRHNPVFAQRYREVRFQEEYVTNSSIYPVFMSNSGIVEGYEVMQLTRGAVTVLGESGYRGEYFFDFPRGERELVLFSPNKLVFDIKLDRSNLLIINQNYHKGWTASIPGHRLAVSQTAGLISVVLPEGEYRLELTYRPQPFLVGGAVSLLTLVLLLAKAWEWRSPSGGRGRKKSEKPHAAVS